MKKIYSAQDSLMISHLKNVLEGRGIECVIKNGDLAIALGELPPIECWPELWVVDETQYPRAEEVLERALAPLGPVTKPWRCVRCGEEVEGEFGECWNCGRRRL